MKNVLLVLVISTIIFLAGGCARAGEQETPNHNFGNFLEKFSENIYFQKSFTRFPLQIMNVVDADPEPVSIETEIDYEQASFLLFPGSKKETKIHLKYQLIKLIRTKWK